VHVELGTYGNDLEPDQVIDYAEARAQQNTPLTFGRTGRKWTLPQPFVLSGAVFAKRRLLERFNQLQEDAWRP